MLSQPPVWLIILAFLGAIGPLVIFHELGHYWVARWFGVGAEQFSIGFGREIGGWTDRRGTRWRIGWLPLGGYVKFIGDSDPTSLTHDHDEPSGASGAAFDARPPWQRFLIILAGPIANFLLAIAIFAAFFAAYGVPSTSSRVSTIVENSAAARAGLRPGDRIVAIAGRQTDTFEDIFRTVSLRPGETVTSSWFVTGVRKFFRRHSPRRSIATASARSIASAASASAAASPKCGASPPGSWCRWRPATWGR